MLRRLSIGLFAAVVTNTPFPLKAHDGFAYDVMLRDQSHKPNIGLCDSLRDDDHQWDNTFTSTIGSWRLIVRNSNQFCEGSITFVEKINPQNAEIVTKGLNSVVHTIAIDSGCLQHANQNIRNEILDTKNYFI